MESSEIVDFLLKYYEKVNLVTRQAPQVGNFCYLISGLELLLSCQTFLRLVQFENDLEQWPEMAKYEISPECKILYKLIPYYIADPSKYYTVIDDVIRKSLDIITRGDQEDINVVFLAFNKSYFFNKLFQYGTWKTTTRPFTINSHKYEGKETTLKILEMLKTEDIYGFIVYADRHYEIYQKFIINDVYKYQAKNTKILLEKKPETITMLIHSAKLLKFQYLF